MQVTTVEGTRTWVGQPLPRREDARFLRGRAEYADDWAPPDVLRVAAVRSPVARARILRIDAARALRVPGVVAVLTADDITGLGRVVNPLPPPLDTLAIRPLAAGEVRFVGEPVAAVVAESAYLAEDAAARVEVEYDPLPAVSDPLAAMRPESPLVHDRAGTNLIWRRRFSFGDIESAFSGADEVVRRRLHFHRFTPAPLETDVVGVRFDPRAEEYLVVSNLRPVASLAKIALLLGVHPRALHFRCPDIGGCFGGRSHYTWVALLCWLARRLGRPVKWTDDRGGNLLASHHGNEIWYDAAIALAADGTIRGLRAQAVHDEGAYVEREPKGAVNQLRHLTSLYRFRDLEIEFSAVLTNKCPSGSNRSYGKAQTSFLIERMVDEAAAAMGLDPVELRRQNFVRPEEMPYETPTGALYDGGDYPEALRLATRLFDYEGFRREQQRARAQGRHLGCGLAVGVEASPSNASLHRLVNPGYGGSGDSETARVRLEAQGQVWVAVGDLPQGQGHETVVAQVVADELGLLPDDVHVTRGFDSRRDPFTPYSGTHASRFATMGVGAVVGAARALRDKALRIAAVHLGCDAGELRLAGGAVVHAQGDASLSLARLVRLAESDLVPLPDDLQPNLDVTYVYRAPFDLPRADGGGNFSLTYAYNATFVRVDVDVETGRVRLERIVSVEDCGRQLNPLIVAGQAHGALAHQAGAALWEATVYEPDGQCATATFKDYLTPTAQDLPSFELGHLETPSPFSVLGARGGGEGTGTALAATIAAVADALSPWGVRIGESHLTPAAVRELVRSAAARPGGDDPLREGGGDHGGA